MTRCLYLHGFASGPGSTKGRAFAEDFGRRGVDVELLDLRLPSLEHLRPSAMIARVLASIADKDGDGRRDDDDGVVLIGSSLGGLTAARVAVRSPAVKAVVLMAPAFRLVERWRERMGEDAWRAWHSEGWLAIEDHAEKKPARVDVGFVEDALALDGRDGGMPPAVVPTWIAHGREDETVDIGLSRTWVAEAAAPASLLELDDDHQLVSSLPTILPAAWEFLAPWLAL
jgi:pimeloyl-ACP methyl ester carboxylesterase